LYHGSESSDRILFFFILFYLIKFGFASDRNLLFLINHDTKNLNLINQELSYWATSHDQVQFIAQLLTYG
jgi:hypothetical protein